MPTNKSLRFPLALNLAKTYSIDHAPLRRAAVLLLGSAAFLFSVQTYGQTIQYTHNKPDQTLRSEMRVDPTTLALSIEVPIASYPGRGGTSIPISLSYSSKQWRIAFEESWLSNSELLRTESIPMFSEWAKAGWTSAAEIPIIEWTGASQHYNYDGTPFCGCGDYGGYWINRIQVHMPGGRSHELRINDTPTTSPVTVGTFYAVDGSNLRYDASSYTDGILYLPDGTRYIINSTSVLLIDRNGNTLTYSAANRTWSDTQGRVLNVPLPATPSATTYTYYLPSTTGTPFSYSVRWSTLGNALTNPSDELHYKTNMTFGLGETWNPRSPALFIGDGASRLYDGPGFPASEKFNPIVLAEITLPNGQHYLFTYNVFGEITKVVYPTGAYERFAYAAIPGASFLEMPYDQGNRGVVDRWLSPSGNGGDEVPWHYAAAKSNFVLTVSTTAPDNTVSQQLTKAETSQGYDTFGFSWAEMGLAFEDRVFAPPSAGGAMLRRTLRSWTTSGPTSGGWATATRNPRVIKQVSILLDTGTGNALTSTTTMSHDADVNVIATNHYDFTSISQSSAQTLPIGSISAGSLVSIDEATYLVNDPAINSSTRTDYRNRNLLHLPTSTRAKNGSGTIVAQTQTNYDETGSYPLLTYGGTVAWNDPGTNVRGLPTTSGIWLNTTGIYLQAHAQYDQFGNVRNTWDAKGNLSQTTYSSSYSYAYPTTATTAVPDPTGVYGSATALITTAVYNANTGLMTSLTDANNQTTSYVYDAINRPATITRPSGGGSTSYAYGDTPGNLYVRTQTSLDASRVIETYQFYDKLGRPCRTFLNEGGSTYLTSDTQYDSLGRSWRTSNPYRTTSLTDPINPSGHWSTSGYDYLGRVLTLTTTDGAVVTTAYSGSTSATLGPLVTVTDQAGKKRRSLTDALGRLVRVDEPDANNNLDSGGSPVQPTAYLYDTLGNLARVTQGGQQRFFMYDSLSRLIRARNPEQDANSSLNLTDPLTGNGVWTVAYQYDNNGNLTQKTNARNVSSTYVYDALNRNTTIDYSDTTGLNPDITRIYDGASNGKGRFWYNYAGGSYSVGTTVEHTAIDSYDAVGRPQIQRQVFKQNSAWGPTYQISRGYNLAGGVISQTYPSGRTVSYTYDDAGRTNNFTGYLGDGTNRTYAAGITYSPWGGLSREQFGTDIPLYHRQHYTNRGQLFDTRVATTDDGSWNRGAIINYYSLTNYGFGNTGADTNGNVYVQQHWIFSDDQMSAHTVHQQNYAYDSLNRITWVGEYLYGSGITGSQTSAQHFTYDRWGNRKIDPITWGTGINNKQFDVNTSNNRLAVPSGQSGVMSYDSAGNLTTDTYSGAGSRSYDAENRMISAQGGALSGLQYYTYNADGQRVRRKVDGVETWQVYGMDGELLAEYAASAAATSPQKEYGYRNGQLLITAANSQGCGLGYTGSKTWAATSPSLGHATGQQEGSNWAVYVGSHSPHAMVFGPYDSSFGQGHHTAQFWLMVDNNSGTDVVATIDVVTGYGSNDLAQRQIRRNEFTAVNQWQVFTLEFNNPCFGLMESRVWWAGTVNMKFSQVTLSASNGSVVDLKWLVADHLGTPRMIFDKTGSLANVKRHDYLPFGEELFAGVGGRTTANGYSGDNVRQKFTEKERDIETGLDYFGARYYASTQGRFIGADPLYTEMRRLPYPQAWNLYSYTRNNPLKYVDDDGMEVRVDCGPSDGKNFKQCVDQTTTDLNNRKGSQFKTEIKNGKLSVVGKVDVRKLSASEAALYKAITDTTNIATLKIQMPGIASADIMFDRNDKPGSNTVDRADLNQVNKVDKSLGGEVIAHAAMEAYLGVAEGLKYEEAHARADQFFGNVAVSGVQLSPPGAKIATGGQATYNFQRLGIPVMVQKTFVSPQPAADITNLGGPPGHLRVVAPSPATPQTKEKKP